MKRLPLLSVSSYRRLFDSPASGPDADANETPPNDSIAQKTSERPPAPAAGIDARVFGRKLGLFSRIVGCAHREVSRPFVAGNTGYKTCLSCGARSPFNPKTFETDGKFYAAPVNGL